MKTVTFVRYYTSLFCETG